MSFAAKSLSVLQRDILLFATNLATSIVVARTLGPHALGLWVILGLIPSYAELFGRPKVDVAAVYFLGRGTHGVSEVLWSLNAIALLMSALITLPIFAAFDWIGPALFGPDAESMRGFTCLMLLQVPLIFIYSNYMYLHIHRENVSAINTMVLTRALVSSATILLLVFGFGLKLGAVVFGSTLGVLLAALVGVLRLGRVARPARLWNVRVLKDLFGYGSQVYVGTMVSHLNQYSSQALVVAYCPPTQVAFFTMAQQWAQLLGKVTEAMGTFLMPRISKEPERAGATQLAARAFRVALILLVALALAALVLIRPAVLLAYGAAFLAALNPFYVILPGIVLACAGTTLTAWFAGVGRADIGMKIAIVPMVVQIGVGVAVIPMFGIMGAAYALTSALCVTALAQVAVFCRLSGAQPRADLLPRRQDLSTVKRFIASTLNARALWVARKLR